jgi:hypothetical protein
LLVEDKTAVDLITKCLSTERDRPTVEELFSHPFFVEEGHNSSSSVTESEDVHVPILMLHNMNSPHRRATAPDICSPRRRELLNQMEAITRQGSVNTSVVPSLDLSNMIIPQSIHEDDSARIARIQQAPQSNIPSDQITVASPRNTPPYRGSKTIKCYTSDHVCIRLYFRDFSTMEQLKALICQDLEIPSPSQLVLRYMDHESDHILITKRTTVEELYEFATTLHIAVPPCNILTNQQIK